MMTLPRQIKQSLPRDPGRLRWPYVVPAITYTERTHVGLHSASGEARLMMATENFRDQPDNKVGARGD